MIRSSFFLFPADNLHTGPAISATSPHRRSHGLPHPEADPTRTHPRASTQPYPRKHPGNPVLILFPHGMPFCPLRPDTLPLQPEPPDQHNPPHSTRPTCAAPFRPPGIKIPTIRTEELNQTPLFPLHEDKMEKIRTHCTKSRKQDFPTNDEFCPWNPDGTGRFGNDAKRREENDAKRREGNIAQRCGGNGAKEAMQRCGTVRLPDYRPLPADSGTNTQ